MDRENCPLGSGHLFTVSNSECDMHLSAFVQDLIGSFDRFIMPPKVLTLWRRIRPQDSVKMLTNRDSLEDLFSM